MEHAPMMKETVDPPVEWLCPPYRISTDPAQLDITAIHAFLTRSSWAAGIDRGTVQQSVAHSLNFGLYHGETQIGFARLVTDYATFGYLCDVYVLEAYQQAGLGRWLMACCQAHPLWNRLRRVMLVTSTAPWLYEKLGYTPVNRENFVWQQVQPDIYTGTR
ncbi:GNAT family N-acetyltransferase [Chimaeribacter arupi]|uniref:GNAT family N-acetyltransferase n=1 Tax=Chimaeribacter arupi TaxID=2060066 RepID=UPI003B984EB2